MKKIYNEPTMNISLFMQEDIVTESAIPEVVTAESQAMTALNDAGVMAENTIKLTF